MARNKKKLYKGYKKIRRLVNSSTDLLKTSMTMEDIFLAITHPKHAKAKALTWLDEKGKDESIKYKNYRTITFETASKISQRLSEITTNSVVALKMKNSPKWPFFFWAILMCGYVPLLIDAKLPKENTEHLLSQAKAKAIITSETCEYSVNTINIEQVDALKSNFRFAVRWADEVIFCSSGTTGNVKLMVFNGRNMCNQIYAATEMPEVSSDIMLLKELNILCIIPFHHIFGFVAVFLWYSFYGKNLVFVKDLSPKEIFSTCQKCDVTHVYSVPLFWDSIAQNVTRKVELEGEKKSEIFSKMIAYNTKKINEREAGVAASSIALKTVQDQLLGHHIRFCISGGGFISKETLNIINGIGYPLYNGFGMTEIGVTSVELSPNVVYRLKGSIGRPLKNVEYKLVNTTKRHPNVGELLIRSPITHVREIIGGVEQEPNVDEEGWLHSGDIAMVDETGYYYLKGRIKDVIINENGENIYPDEIESYFRDIDHVANVCVIGVKKGHSHHETITCIFELKNDVTDDILEDIKNKCVEINNKLTNEKRVGDFLIFKDRLPLTASMKVKRFEVKELYNIKPKYFLSFNEKKEIKSFDGYDMKDVEPVVKTVRKIFSKTLLLPSIKIGDDDHWINDLGGDSMSYVELITTINEEFKVEIPEEKYAVLTSVNEFAEAILELLGVQKKK